jgi:drug/metabolite transporter (DMT)-like permease
MEVRSDRPIIPPLLAIPFGILAVSTASIMIRFIQAQDVPSLVIAAWRLTLASLLLAPFALTRHLPALRALKPPDFILASLSGIFLAVHFATWISSLELTSVASSVLFVSTSPLWVAILAPLTLREPISRLVWIGMLLALIGGMVVGLSDSCSLDGLQIACPPWKDFIGRQAFMGDALALVGALAGAGYILIGRRLRDKMAVIPYVFLVYSISALFLILIMFAAGDNPVGYQPNVYLWFLFLAVIPQLLGHSTFNWALRYLSASYVSITLLGEPIGSSILAYFFLSEIPSGLMVFGAILILIGIFIASNRASVD